MKNASRACGCVDFCLFFFACVFAFMRRCSKEALLPLSLSSSPSSWRLGPLAASLPQQRANKTRSEESTQPLARAASPSPSVHRPPRPRPNPSSSPSVHRRPRPRARSNAASGAHSAGCVGFVANLPGGAVDGAVPLLLAVAHEQVARARSLSLWRVFARGA